MNPDGLKGLKRHVTELKLLRRGLLVYADRGKEDPIPVDLTELQIGVIAYALSYVSMAEQLGQFEEHGKMLDHIGATAGVIARGVERSDPSTDWNAEVAEADRWLQSLLNAENN